MSRPPGYEPSTRPSGAWAGWITFASVILVPAGALSARDEARAAM
jgi:hypothetical protein